MARAIFEYRRPATAPMARWRELMDEADKAIKAGDEELAQRYLDTADEIYAQHAQPIDEIRAEAKAVPVTGQIHPALGAATLGAVEGAKDLIMPLVGETPQEHEARLRRRESLRQAYPAASTAGAIAGQTAATAPLGPLVGRAAPFLAGAGRLGKVGKDVAVGAAVGGLDPYATATEGAFAAMVPSLMLRRGGSPVPSAPAPVRRRKLSPMQEAGTEFAGATGGMHGRVKMRSQFQLANRLKGLASHLPSVQLAGAAGRGAGDTLAAILSRTAAASQGETEMSLVDYAREHPDILPLLIETLADKWSKVNG